MTIKGVKNHFVNWREWELNPIVIKEMRQAVRSWAVTGMLLLFLAVLFITSLIFLIDQSFVRDADMGLGGSMFSAFVTILGGASIFFIPLYVGVRIAGERQENNPDLLYVTTLSPRRIILGKFICGAYMAVLFFSACMPFMAFTNLLRGVDLPTIFFILAYLFLGVCAANMVAIFLACVPASRAFKVLLALAGFIASFWVVIPLVMASFEFMRSGVGAMMGARSFWINTLTAIGVGSTVIGLLFFLSVALISPPSANRALPLRLYITITWLLGGGFCIIWVAQTGDYERIAAWSDTTFAVMIVALIVTVCNSDQISLRVRRRIPHSGLKRAVAFLFFNGAAGGLVWVASILIVTYLVTSGVIILFPKGFATRPEEGVSWFSTTAAYAFAYALTALFIQRKFLSRRPPKLAGLLAIILAGLWAIAPSIVLFFLNQLSWKAIDGLQLGNIFNIFSLQDNVQRLYHLYFAFSWLLLVLLINAKWFIRQLKGFRPLTDKIPVNHPPVLQ